MSAGLTRLLPRPWRPFALLARFDRPTLVLHGDDDQIVPIGASALETVKLVPQAELNIYAGADHGLTQTHQDRFNADLLTFIRG